MENRNKETLVLCLEILIFTYFQTELCSDVFIVASVIIRTIKN